MDESFDPYRKWLSIPPEEQPPHHYRLLGLELFEANADVIVNAADARMAFLKTLSADMHAEMAERIAVQIKEAQSCLLDPAKKAFYDGQLKRRIAALKKEPPPLSVTPGAAANPMAAGPKIPPVAPAADFILPKLQTPPSSKPPSHPRPHYWPTVAAAILGLAATVCILVFLIGKSGSGGGTPSTQVVQSDPKNGNNPGTKPASAAPRVDSPAGGQTEKPASANGNAEEDLPENGGASATLPKPNRDNPFERSINEDEKDPEEEGTVETPGSTSNPPRNIEDPTAASEGNASTAGGGRDNPPSPPRRSGMRQPIPEEAALQAAEKTVREIYGAKIAAAKSGNEKQSLADLIRRQAADTKNDPPARYALMAAAFQLIGDSGQLQRASLYADSFARYFEVDAWELKADAVAKAIAAARNNTPGLDGNEIVLLCEDLAEEAKQAGQIEVASKIVKAAIPLAKKDQLLFGDLNKLAREIDKLKARYQPVRKALDALKDKPDDADANALAGRWICFESHDWERGLPMLAKSSDAALSILASRDMNAPNDADGQLEIADAWWELAQKEKDEGINKPGMSARAGHWYRQALPKLDGLNKTKAETRLKSIGGGDKEAAPGKGAMKAGNVALAKNGAIVRGVRMNADKLFDGESENPSWDGGAANSPAPCEWTITLDKVYQLREIRFHFYNGDSRFYHYRLAVSSDGTNYKTIIERNQGQWFGSQVIPFTARPVKSIKLYGTFSYNNKLFSVTEFEAYCIPPKK